MTLFIILGLLQFAKQAPKFLTDMLGLKGGGDIASMFKGAGSMFASTVGTGLVGSKAARLARVKSKEAGESEEVQRYRARMAAMNARGRFIADRIRGKKYKESSSGAVDKALTSTGHGIQRTAGYTQPGEAASMTNVRAARKGYISAKTRSYLGQSPEIAKFDSAMKSLQGFAKATDTARSTAKNHKIWKQLNKNEETLSNANLMTIRDMLEEEIVDLETKSRNGVGMSVKERERLQTFRTNFGVDNGDGTFGYDVQNAKDSQIETQKGYYVNEANRVANDFTKDFVQAATDETYRNGEFTTKYGGYAAQFGFDSVEDFFNDGYHMQNVRNSMESEEYKLKAAINSNSEVDKFFGDGGLGESFIDASGHIAVGNRKLYDAVGAEENRMVNSPEYNIAQANSVGFNNNNSNGGH